ncbi:MAG: protein kinase [Ignavibacteriales bacterium]|nr:protein kinase [Ignavibacteriales bacterium]
MIGQIISHYKIIEKLGEGGMGVVYRAHDTKLNRDVALKFLPANLTASFEDIQRFELEAKAISALNHPNIATIYDVDEFSGQKYLVLEYISGGTLKSKLKQLKSEDKEFPISEVVNYGIQMAEALAHAHRHQIIHRDVKTDNMMLTEDGKVKLTDFGLAKLRGSVQITKTGSTLGTAAYMSPEQIRGEEVDQRSDIFSFGIVLYELVTSHLPFRGQFEAALSYSILNENPPSVKLLRQNVPQALEQIINRCLEKDKTKRYQSVDEVVKELKNIERDFSRSPERSKDRSTKSVWIVAAVVVVLAVLGIYLFYPKPVLTSANSKTIAVLPFNNMSGNQEDEYFSDGVTEDILTQLSKIADLNVISRTTIMQYKSTKKPLKEIGKELNAGVVLEGSVRHAGNRIRISSQLIDAATDRHLWAETYDRDMKDVFAIQSDVAQQIAFALRAKLSADEKLNIEKAPTENTEAYHLYLKGRFYWNKRRAEDVEKAMTYFQQAIDKDSNYALAYAGLAAAYLIYPDLAGRPRKEYVPTARILAIKAIKLDGTLAEPHAVLGTIKRDFEWDWEGAKKEYERAIELDPNYPTAHQWYGLWFLAQGRFDEALTEMQRALSLDPLSLIINSNLGYIYECSGRYESAIDQFKKTIDLDPNFANVHTSLGMNYIILRRFNEGIAELQKRRSLDAGYVSGIADLGWAYARAGRRSEALRSLNEILALSKKGNSLSLEIAYVYVALGDMEKAFEWLNRAAEERNSYLRWLKVDPSWDNLRGDLRYHELLKKIGLEK